MIAGQFRSLIKCCFICWCPCVFAFYDHIVDICHPTLEELQVLQYALSHAKRPETAKLIDKALMPRRFKLIGKSAEEMPYYAWAAVNCSEEERENCVITYASFNERYPVGAKRLYETVLRSNFKGHIHCRIGGWPDIEGGNLVLAHVPFAFKVCFIKEMQRKGYKKIFWMDASLLPVMSLNQIFDKIGEEGYLIEENIHTLAPPLMNSETAAYFGYTLEEASSLLSCSAAYLGFDLTNPRVVQLIDDWYRAAKSPHAFYSARSDQTALSLLLHKAGMTRWVSYECTGNACRPRTPEMIVFMEREYVKKL